MASPRPSMLIPAVRQRASQVRGYSSSRIQIRSPKDHFQRGSTRYFTSTTAFKHDQTRLPAFLHKSDTINPDPHDIRKAVGDINKAVGDINKAVGDINKALGDSHQELPSIFSGKEKYHPESGVPRPSQIPSADSAITALRVKENVMTVNGVEFPNIWLRDNCQCSHCIHEATRQRLIDIFTIPKDIQVKSFKVNAGGVHVEWSDGHKSYYTSRFLYNATGTFQERAVIRQGLRSPALWGSEIEKSPPTVTYDEVMHQQSTCLHSLLSQIREFGFCFVDSVPHDSPHHTEEVLKRIAFIRETHYGGFYDFTADLASKDMAYTSVALPAHTDNTYFSDPAGLQAFHILSHTDGSGGASLLVDGFKAARDLLDSDPSSYRILSQVNVHAHASGNDGISIQPYRGFPVLSHDPSTGLLLQVRWNTADRCAIELPVSDTPRWYDAASKFDAILKRKENEFWELLTPGRVLIFDNWRVLHGRSAFTGKRRVCGAYINRDDWVSRFKMLTWGQEDVLGQLSAS